MNQTCPCFQKYILITFILMTSVARAQTRLNEMDTNRIRQKSIRQFLKSQLDSGIINFEDFKPSVDAQTDSSQFDSNIHRFNLQQTPAVAWNTYITAHPAKVWEGKIVSCGFIYSPVSKRVIFPDDKYSGLETGQIFFIEMKVLFGLVRFPVCFMVTKIDEAQRTIAFSYVSSGSSKGSQTIRLDEDGKGGTNIFHSSIHQTENILRDKTLYPIYHRKAIKEVHHNIKKILEMK
jgi:hypothetical protein